MVLLDAFFSIGFVRFVFMVLLLLTLVKFNQVALFDFSASSKCHSSSAPATDSDLDSHSLVGYA